MKHRTFGRSGIKVSEIIFGAGAVGGILIHKDDETKREAIRRAIGGHVDGRLRRKQTVDGDLLLWLGRAIRV